MSTIISHMQIFDKQKIIILVLMLIAIRAIGFSPVKAQQPGNINDPAYSCGKIINDPSLGTVCSTVGFGNDLYFNACQTVGPNYDCCDVNFSCPAEPPPTAPGDPPSVIITPACGSTVVKEFSDKSILQCNCNVPSGTVIVTDYHSTTYCCGWRDDTIADKCSANSPSPLPPPGEPEVVVDCTSVITAGWNVPPTSKCGCTPVTDWKILRSSGSTAQWCCGYINQSTCVATNPDGGSGGGGGTGGATEEETEPTLNIFEGPGKNDFDLLNPLKMFDSPYADNFSSPAGIINRALRFAFPLAGLILFVMIVWGGFEVLTGAANSKGVQAGKQRITAALLGIGLLFVSFWIIQIVEYIFNLAIL